MQMFLVLQMIAIFFKNGFFKINECFAYGHLVDGNKLEKAVLQNRIRVTCSLYGINQHAYNLYAIVENDESPLGILEDKNTWSKLLHFNSKTLVSFVQEEIDLVSGFLSYSVIAFVVQALIFAIALNVKKTKTKYFFQTIHECILIVLILWNNLLFLGQYNDISSLTEKTIFKPSKLAEDYIRGIFYLPTEYFKAAIESDANKNELINGYSYISTLSFVNYTNAFYLVLLLGFFFVLVAYFFLKLYRAINITIEEIIKNEKHAVFRSIV